MIIIVTVPPYQISVILISSFCINILCLLCPIVKNKTNIQKTQPDLFKEYNPNQWHGKEEE